METVLITGGSGMIGTALSELLIASGYKVIVLSRSAKHATGNLSYATWDIANRRIDKTAITSSDHIIHLAGANVSDKRWTKKRKQEIADSRVMSGELLMKTMKDVDHKVKTFISASGIGWYGPDAKTKPRPFVETDPSSTDFLGETCRLWEQSVEPVALMGIRLVIFRTAIALSKKGGAFPEFEKPMKGGVAAILGDGKQILSWIHIDDLCRMYLHAITNSAMQGPYNAVAPERLSNKDFTLQLAKSRNRRFIPIHVPEFALKIVLGEMSVEVLKSASVDNGRIRNTGFNYLYPSVDAAFNALLH